MKFFGKGTTTRLIEEPEEKKQKLVQFFSENIHNKVTWVIRLNQKLNSKIGFKVQSADLTCDVIKKVAPWTDVLNLQTE